MCGMAGGGKTTRARQIEAATGAVRLSPDEWIARLMADTDDRAEADRLRDTVEALQWETAQRLLAAGADVILENGFWGADERSRCRDTARALGAAVCLHFLDPPEEELWRRLQERNARLAVGAYRVNRAELREWIGWFQKPDAAELATYDDCGY
ncbi:MAG: ATP-binding protein [Planctomycetota bacterium]